MVLCGFLSIFTASSFHFDANLNQSVGLSVLVCCQHTLNTCVRPQISQRVLQARNAARLSWIDSCLIAPAFQTRGADQTSFLILPTGKWQSGRWRSAHSCSGPAPDSNTVPFPCNYSTHFFFFSFFCLLKHDMIWRLIKILSWHKACYKKSIKTNFNEIVIIVLYIFLHKQHWNIFFWT